MSINYKQVTYISFSTLLYLTIMLVSTTEFISWSVWAQNVTPGMSLIGYKIFSYAPDARLWILIVSALISIAYAANGPFKRYFVGYLVTIISSGLIVNYLASIHLAEFHIGVLIYLILLQTPVYYNLYQQSQSYSHFTFSFKSLLNESVFWMLIVLVFGMISFHFYFEHPKHMLPIQLAKYGFSNDIYPYLLHFAVLANFAILTVVILFVTQYIVKRFKSDYVRVIFEVVVFLLFVGFIIQGILRQLHHEIDITESGYVANLMSLYVPIIFSPFLLVIILFKAKDPVCKRVGTIFSTMYLFGNAPISVVSGFIPIQYRTKWIRILGLIVMSLVFFALAIYLFRGLFFNPWYTVFSPIKGFSYALTVWVGSTLLYVAMRQSDLFTIRMNTWVGSLVIASVMIFAGLIPRSFHNNPGLKGMLVQYSESVKISLDGLKTFYPEYVYANLLKSGQSARLNDTHSIHPGPLNLESNSRSVLNDSLSYIFIMADAFRGDFYEGRFNEYDSLYPFMNKWMKEECIWFRHAYSQSNGSYIGIPSLLGAHGNRSILKPNSKEENRFFQFVRKEGIQEVYGIDGYSLDNLYPDENKVISIGKVPDDFDSFNRNVTAMEILNRLKLVYEEHSGDNQFMAYLQLLDTHNNYARKDGFKDYGNRTIDLYAHNIHYLDNFVKELVEWLKEINQYENTVIVFTADHGEEFYEHRSSLHGHNFFQEVMRVPIIMKLPDVAPRVINTPVLNSDIFPTLAALRGYDVSKIYSYDHLGIDISSLILDSDSTDFSDRDMLMLSSQNTKHALFRLERYKMIYWPRYDSYVFYDLLTDPNEYENQVEENSMIAKEMYDELLDLILQTNGGNYENLWPNIL